MNQEKHRGKNGWLDSRTMKSNAVCSFEFIISHCETGLFLQRRKRGNLNPTNKLYRGKKKKRTFECAGRFSDFFY